MVETDSSETALVRAVEGQAPATLVTARGRIRLPLLLPGGRLRFRVVSGGEARLWEWDGAGSPRPWVRSSPASSAVRPCRRTAA